VRILLGIVTFFSLLSIARAAPAEQQAPHQPIEFDHRLHAGTLKVQCKMCHPNADPGDTMGLPEVATCMQCHSAIPPKNAAMQKLQAFAKQDRDVDWVRVYQIPSYVSFSHRTHLNAGASCQTCHGSVAEQVALFKEKEISMGACMDCHRTKKASIDCSYCHAPR
jgi:Zn ribbon nucleic-acid-binding protein